MLKEDPESLICIIETLFLLNNSPFPLIHSHWKTPFYFVIISLVFFITHVSDIMDLKFIICLIFIQVVFIIDQTQPIYCFSFFK